MVRLRFWTPKAPQIELVKAFDWDEIFSKTAKGEAVVKAFRSVLEQYGPDIGYNPSFSYEELVNYLLTLCDILEEAAQKAIDELAPYRESLYKWLSTKLPQLPRWLFDFIYDTLLLNAYGYLKDGFNWLRGKIPSFVTWVAEKAKGLYAWIRGKLSGFYQRLRAK